MERFIFYACVWSPGALAVVGFLIAMVTSRRFAVGEITHMEGYYTILPCVWIPVFLLLPAAILGLVLLCMKRWTALIQLGASVGLVFAWGFYADSGPILKRETISEVAPFDGEKPAN